MNVRTKTLDTIRTALDNLTTLRGLNTRPSQNQMISSIAQVLLDAVESQPAKGSNLIAIEAPTGTGKSFGYLLPAIPIAIATGKKIVVSTAVISLQEQLVSKDLPALKNAIPIPFTFAIAKGRSRFVCPSRLKDKNNEMESQGYSQTKEAQALSTMAREWQTKKWNGEQETLHISEEQRKVIWPKVTTDNSGCSGKLCKEYKGCPYFEAKKIWKDANVIVANHDLVMSDLKISNEGALLSPPAQTIYIFDEAHHLPNKAREAWSNTFKTDTFQRMMREIPVNMEDTAEKWMETSCTEAQSIATKIKRGLPNLKIAGKNMEVAMKDLDKVLIKTTSATMPKEPFVLSYTEKYNELMASTAKYLEVATEVKDLVQNVLAEISKVRLKITNPATVKYDSPLIDDNEMNRVLGAFGFYKNRLSNLCDTLEMFGKEQPDNNKPPIAKWIIPDEKHKTFTVNTTHTMATELLPNYLYNQAFAVVHASATLTSIGTFQLFKQKTGLCYYPSARMLKLDSPFDFKKNATLAFGDLGVNPSETEKHTQRLVETLPHIFEEEPSLGTLVLFSSKSQLQQVAARMTPKYRKLCKVQYEAPNQVLIDAHKADVDAGKRSILMGTQSFSEGLDLPGAWCSHVISTKLPFSMPDNPIDKTLSMWLESNGRSVFKEIAVPEASERLIQQAGRLLRREDDTGQFTLLDNRLINKWSSYGRMLVESLPPFKRKRWQLQGVKHQEANIKQPEILNYETIS